MYRFGMIPNGVFRPGIELITYLDGNLSSNGLDDPALAVQLFNLPWWTEEHMPIGNSLYLSSTTLRSALDHYRHELVAALIDSGVPHHILNFANELNKPAYTWHSAVNDTLPNDPTDCTRCRLYRAVAVGVMDQVRDVYNMVHGCEIANEAERDIGIRRASGFNELHEAALKKECEIGAASGPGSGMAPDQRLESKSGKGKEKQFGPEVESLKKLMMELVKSGGEKPSSKWTWGVDLTKADLLGLIRGADGLGEDSHSGYDSPLPSDSLADKSSEALDADKLEDPEKTQLRFDHPASSIASIPELPPDEIPTYSDVDGMLGEELIDPEPDLVLEAFTKRAKVQAGKMLMQDEVDQPVSYRDYGSEFNPQIALIRKRPWLMPSLPIILPPTNIADNMGTESDADGELPDIPELDDIPGHIDIPDSDHGPDSSTSSELIFPVSDDHESDAMDVVRSDEHDIPISDGSADSGLDIVFPQSPVATETTGASGAMVGIERDPSTGRFTAASFVHFPDELLD